MTFSTYFNNYIFNLAKTERLLVVHDEEGRYRGLCESLTSRGILFVDGDRPTLEVRETLAPLWAGLPANPSQLILLYRSCIPSDPFQDSLVAFERVGRLFPEPGAAHEEYRSLVRGAYPDRGDEVDALFAGGEPTIAAVDSLATGNRYPSLTGHTGKSAPIEIILDLLTQDSSYDTARASPPSRSELETLLGSTISLPTTMGNLPEIWRFILYSEFALSLGAALPSGLSSLPQASIASKPTISTLCRRLRAEHPSRYLDEAERIERELDLASEARDIEHFAEIDTFAFQSAAALRSTVDALVAGKLEEAAATLVAAEASLWSHHDFRLQSTWELLRQAMLTLEAMAKAPAHECAGDPVAWYRGLGLSVDRSYRSFVFVYSRLEDENPYGARLADLVEFLAERYRQWIDAVQGSFLGKVKRDGWPLHGLARQDRIFPSEVASALVAGKRVAYFLVDALRYELGDALAGKLEGEHKVTRSAAAALLPTKTPLGMAALAPDTAGALSISLEADGWTVSRGSTRLPTVADRDALYSAYKGDQVLVETLERWLARGPRQKPEAKIQLAVIRSQEIDSAGEVAESVFRSSLENLMTGLARAVRKCFAMGFDRVVITADHGFLYLPLRKPGDQVSLPLGTLLVKGDRYAFGSFEPSEAIISFNSATLGYPLNNAGGKAVSLVMPASVGSLAKPATYIHGGLSLQEALIPVLVFEALAKKAEQKITVTLCYRDKKKARCTSLTPSVMVAVIGSAQGLGFEEDWATRGVEIEVAIKDGSGNTIGSIGANEFLDSDTGFLRIRPGTSSPIPLRINEDFRGSCMVSASDPTTGKQFDRIDLDIDVLD